MQAKSSRASSDRQYPVRRDNETGGTYFHVTCSKCEAYASVSAHKHLPPPVIEQKFRQKGWRLSNDPGKDLCVVCSAPAPKEASITTPSKVQRINAFMEKARPSESTPKSPPLPAIANSNDEIATTQATTILDDIRNHLSAIAAGTNHAASAIAIDLTPDLGLDRDGRWTGKCLSVEEMGAKRKRSGQTIRNQWTTMLGLSGHEVASLPAYMIKLRDDLLAIAINDTGAGERKNNPWLKPLLTDARLLAIMITAINKTINGDKLKVSAGEAGNTVFLSRTTLGDTWTLARKQAGRSDRKSPRSQDQPASKTGADQTPVDDKDITIGSPDGETTPTMDPAQEQNSTMNSENIVNIADAPRQPTGPQKFMIQDMVRDNYGDKFNSGYLDGMSDDAIAKKLNMPRA
jgi:hypothetical protein